MILCPESSRQLSKLATLLQLGYLMLFGSTCCEENLPLHSPKLLILKLGPDALRFILRLTWRRWTLAMPAEGLVMFIETLAKTLWLRSAVGHTLGFPAAFVWCCLFCKGLQRCCQLLSRATPVDWSMFWRILESHPILFSISMYNILATYWLNVSMFFPHLPGEGC